jgi:hypothetical protein
MREIAQGKRERAQEERESGRGGTGRESKSSQHNCQQVLLPASGGSEGGVCM